MTIQAIKKNRKALRKSKNKVKRIGIKSIHDIIYNTPQMSFLNKLNYIRHHYTYYDGNQEVFFKDDGKPTYYRYELNKLIGAVINRQVDPSMLKEYNKKILKKSKELKALKAKYEAETELELISNETVLKKPRWIEDLNADYTEDSLYVKIINRYLNDPIKKEFDINTISYSKLKKHAIQWDKRQKDSLFFEYDEDRRIRKLMKQYDLEKKQNANKKE